ncbi:MULTISPECIES: methyltransferase domain-containing protein [Rhodopseudomonas]|uniref:Methyltransferase type 11 n=1 Tax=Rhodopseudomonas palustris TaxID=1076 RepID=A0A0D7E6F5_RHOPL|nr:MULTISPECIES: methyltransferase domain-containing protein [Rhodopseudomonas]KIZ35132.1 methyltransferase type 11 [Rhodopseudomonas palustris]MDF3812062.1 methyltransferase domain-containing protein [Rhodopseudomonas sp. BAL398]WOK16079.1 methyltransferase domain-containing protein [Rhodopseudomonas sp. BAL398]
MAEAPQLFTDGQAYERIMGRWSRVVGVSFLDWLAVPAGQRWLDSGCGNGAFTEEIISRCAPAAVHGVDPSEGQIGFARARPATRLAQFAIGDAQALSFGDGDFDAAIMALVIAFLPDPARAVAELKRVTRPGGFVATYMWDIANGGTPLAPVGRAMRSLGIPRGVRPNEDASGLAAMRSYWEGAGLVAVETKVIRISVAYSDFDDYWASNSAPVGPQGVLISQMPPQQRDALRARLREQLPIAADGSISYHAIANAVKGRVPD